MADYTSFADTPVSPARSIKAVTPDDDADLPDGVCKSVYVLTDGNLEVQAENDSAAVTIPVTAGMHIPVMAKRILEDTTATVVAFY
jgi:hypothetical protein